MVKDVNDYTPEELLEIGKKAVQARQKEAKRNKERAALTNSLVKAWREGKIDIPGIPKP